MVLGRGTEVYIGTGDTLETAVFKVEDKVAHLKSVGEQTTSFDEIEVTDLDSGKFKEFDLGQGDNGSIPIEGNIVEDNYTKIKALEGKKVPAGIAHPTQTDVNMKFMALVKDVKRGPIEPGGTLTFSAELRITGAVEDFTAPITGVTE